MPRLLLGLLLPLLMMDVSFAVNIIAPVPFNNILMNPQDRIISSYNFGPFVMIFCYDNTLQTQGSITWPFQGARFSSSLPIFLKTNPNFEGQFADQVGTIVIVNTTPTFLVMNCNFGY